MNLVYAITNKINGKRYVGRTTQSLKKRWSQHVARFACGDRDHNLYLAMKKHGIENFTISPICCVLKGNDFSEMETMFIKEYDTIKNGYNMVMKDGEITKEARMKISEKMKGRKITWIHKILETKRKNNTFIPGVRWGKDHAQHGRYYVKRPDGKIDEIHGLRAYCRKYDLDHKTLLDILKGKQTHHKGFVLLSRFNDYSERKYTQASGNGAYPVFSTG